MKSLPIPNQQIIESIDDWITGNTLLPKASHDNIKNFYQSLEKYGVKHDSKQLFYRGLKISEKGLVEFFKTDVVKLKGMGSESWTCEMEIAERFVNYPGGMVLAKKIPHLNVIINLGQVIEVYSKYYCDVDMNDDYFSTCNGWLDTLDNIKVLDECELITKTICTKCSIDDVVSIMVSSYKPNMTEVFSGFLDSLNIKRGMSRFDSLVSSGKIGFDIELVRDSERWILYTDGNI